MENDKLNLLPQLPGSTFSSSSVIAYPETEIELDELPSSHIVAETSVLGLSKDEGHLSIKDDSRSVSSAGRITLRCSKSFVAYYPDGRNWFPTILPLESSGSMLLFESTLKNERFSNERKSDFFGQLGDVPNVQDIPDDISDHSEVTASNQSKFTSDELPGPLKGSSLSIDINDSTLDYEEEVQISEEYDVEEEYSTLEFSFENFDDKYPKDEDLAKGKDVSVGIEKLLRNSYVEIKPKIIQVEEELTPENLLRPAIEEFIDDLFQDVITTYENCRDVEGKTNKMDKIALFRDLVKFYREFSAERHILKILDNKATKFFRKKGSLRYICTDKNYTDQIDEKYSYMDTLGYLDNLLGEEKQIESITRKKIQLLRVTQLVQEEEAKQEIRKFEKLVRDTLKCGTSPRLTEVMNKSFKDMAKIRGELCKEASALIKVQHTLIQQKMKMNALNDLGDGLQLADYVNLEYETSALSKKLEDRKKELVNYHGRLQNNLNIIAHFKFNKDILGSRVRSQGRFLDELIDERDICRQQIHDLKQQRNRRRKDICDLINKNGLISRPLLMKDYDKTSENVELKRKSVETLRETKSVMDRKLEILEKSATG